MFSNNDIRNICNSYGVDFKQISNVIDTSHDEDDKRYNYIIDNKYVLKITNFVAITERFLEDISRLIERYISIGVYCPNIIRNKMGTLTYEFIKEGKKYTCYMEEYALYNFYKEGELIDYDFKKTVIKHIGELARNFTNVDLSNNRSMWSLIELGPFDIDIDEKQENLDNLIKKLKEKGYNKLASKLVDENIKARNKIELSLNELPRCVYQGDLNYSNILVDDNDNFVGIIDFNMFGTEVNINCFLNETMYYLTIEDFETLTAKEIYSKMKIIQDDMMQYIL
ncbi:MAG: phosphotransferase [Clostridium celatum]|nr:phosphotransferase [Clostridium celatum]